MSDRKNPQAARRGDTAGERLKIFLTASLCLALALLLLLTPQEGLAGARQGLSLCAAVVIPSLFPFLVLCVFVVSSGLAQKAGVLFEPLTRRVLRLPGCAAATLVMGMIGGYPVGAKAAAGLRRRGALSKEEGDRLLAFCINSSPAFIIGAVGTGMLRSTDAGILLYIAHIGASLLLGAVLALLHRVPPASAGRAGAAPALRRAAERNKQPLSACFVYAVSDSARSMLAICAFVVLFSALSATLAAAGVLTGTAALLAGVARAPGAAPVILQGLIGLLEVTNGCAAASHTGGLAGLLLISAMLAWSGFSVHFQVMASIGNSGLSARRFILTRPLHMLFSVGLTLLLFHFYPAAVPAFAGTGTALSPAFHSAPASTALLLLCAMLLLSLVHV